MIVKSRPHVKQKFEQLRRQWWEETAHLSSAEQRAIHPSYQQIIGMGPDVVPLILQSLDAEPDDWFWALHAITCEDPIPAEKRGNMRAMADAWIDWGIPRNTRMPLTSPKSPNSWWTHLYFLNFR